LFFYPKDDTPGCTREACSFRDHYEAFLDAGAEVIGISGQSVESHKNFAQKHNLKYHLLSRRRQQSAKTVWCAHKPFWFAARQGNLCSR
jgi:thioredoxin-dependent peroxiredoxin